MIIKRNNPGNLRPSARKWQGEITRPGDKYCEFATLEWGCRAMLKILATYRNKYKLTTIEGIISRWAPPEDHNDTAAYIRIVSQRLKVSPQAPLSASLRVPLARAMARVETGQDIPLEIWWQADAML